MTGAAGDIVAWTVGVGLEGLGQADLLAGYCERLVDAGVPLWRASMGADTLHPLNAAQGHRWLIGKGVREEFYDRAPTPEGAREWRQSPWYWMIKNDVRRLRRRPLGEGSNEFPIPAALAARGGTDYWARLDYFTGERGGIGDAGGPHHKTCEPGGFVERDFTLIDDTPAAFALAFKASIAIDTAHTLVTTLSRDAACACSTRSTAARSAVPGALVQRSAGFLDCRHPTARSAAQPARYADCLVGVIHDHGGEVLKFMGDGILGVFSGALADACRRALDAAEAARAALARLNQTRSAAGLAVTGFTLALHEGEVLSGNVGSQERLDFTVVGPAVNELSRIER